LRRRLLLVGAVVLGLFAVAILALPYVVSLESTKSRILAAAESALHRQVEAGAIRLEILSGLGAGIEKAAVGTRRDGRARRFSPRIASPSRSPSGRFSRGGSRCGASSSTA
jgi:hypothetical protein